ncbi:MetQ/NlpA family ABC transporter substrate-binding protein [Leuconostoc carnosum]|uniref:Lipoprotein n=2 Tax=Leuconostoc carnosum TaxID=1252 RepID=K0D911_LEUCJ|nr:MULTISPECIES: MetQ/NlpA family ABC transporter substrate-binding protein [Leuconostoc]AFT81270.1 outer membrane lipoprotein [Leuconostoc carnosum JB16]KAA8326602.1 MetQ/NlpA family ABC transporter substrate-binding protein [Leuconostoc carnosum]KAA8330089.1 MetQ/NlpA family ABC transporter substrate-binding protein [Leuconostoc carnosum]KAA8362163.1 MetQ/NlpA family ABC transporter substrate-binding protein [Leuconostoc carnosum]KAA8366712.1 MetQ/NlpA family ABC transporter substrate-bindin
MSKTSKWLIGGIAVIVIGGIAYATLGRNSSKSDDKVVKVGIMSGSKQDAEIWKTVANTAKDKYGITLKFKEFSDYTQPNKALADGDIDLNAFQHYSFLNASNKSTGDDIVAIGDTVISPIRLYSNTHKKLSEYKKGDTIAVPNDTSNESRSLYVLKAAGLIDLKSGLQTATAKDITKNPKQLKIKELAADQTARSLSDVEGAVVNGTYADTAGLDYKKAIYVEPINKDSHQWVNIIAANKKDKDKAILKNVVKAYQTKATKDTIQKEYKGVELAAWDTDFSK